MSDTKKKHQIHVGYEPDAFGQMRRVVRDGKGRRLRVADVKRICRERHGMGRLRAWWHAGRVFEEESR